MSSQADFSTSIHPGNQEANGQDTSVALTSPNINVRSGGKRTG
jgi:hypothetical protein